MLDTRYEKLHRSRLADVGIGKLSSIFAKMSARLKDDWTAGIIFENLDNNPAMLDRLTDYLRRGCVHTSADQRRAMDIMGKNFCSPGEVMVRLGESYTEDQLASLETVPYSDQVLMVCAKTHVLFPGFILSAEELYNRQNRPDVWRNEAGGRPILRLGGTKTFGCEDDFWVRKKLEVRWYLVATQPKKAVLNYRDQCVFAEQAKSLGQNEYIPHAIELLYPRWAKSYLNIERGEYLTASVSSNDRRVVMLTAYREATVSSTSEQQSYFGGVASAITPMRLAWV